ncbi:hypothetical protein Q3G72_005083 [Acer saccharum]|nr:hypothetical protein Q3G72_005083 [Acer saccharum]
MANQGAKKRKEENARHIKKLHRLIIACNPAYADNMGEEKNPSAGVWPTAKPFVNGGASGMLATCVIQPVDMIKVRIQLGQGSAASVTKNMLANEGIGGFYKGLSAGLLRQATYTTARLGSFKIVTAKAIEANDGKPLPLYQKALCGLTAGAIGASVGSPADLALIRMQADATLPLAQRRNYTNAFHALYRISSYEGILALWKGAGPTVVRAMAANMGMLASYDQSVEFLMDSLGCGELTTVVGASAISGFFAAACSLPFDYVKTQIQKMQPDAQGKYPYTGSLDCAMKTLKAGGPFKFYTDIRRVHHRDQMANQGAKKRKEENARHIKKLHRLIIACNVIYVLVRMLIFHSSFTWKHWIGLVLTSVAYAVPYQQLAALAKPAYADDGELLDGGFDMSTGGICGYFHDVIYITSFVQIMSILSEKFWYTYLVIPAYGAYQSFGFIRGFFSQGSEGDTEDEKSRKKREKMEKKASRGKFVKTRTR